MRLRSAVVVLAAFGSVVLTVGAVLPAARGGAPPPDFVLGSGEAKADTVAAGITAGGATIGLTWGRVLAKYQESTGIAEGRALDLGIIEDLFGASCDGSPPTLNPATFPPPVRVDSREPGAEQSRRSEVRSPGAVEAGATAGRQDARATGQPWAWAGTETVDTDLFLIGLTGGRAEAHTEIVDGTRRAVAVVTGSELSVLGGLVLFREPRWEAEASSGGEAASEGRFTFDSARVLGMERSVDEAEDGFDRLAADVARSMAALGVHLDYPQVRVEDKRVTVTPMRFAITDPPAGARYLAPALERMQPLREVFVDLALKLDCNNATTITLLDVVLAILAGAGSINFTAGGVEVSTDDTVFANPFSGGATVGAVAGAGTGSVPSKQSTAPLTVPEPAVAPAPASAPGESLAGPALDTAGNRRFLDGATGGSALAVGVVALAVAAGLALGDYLVMRRSRRRIPDA